MEDDSAWGSTNQSFLVNQIQITGHKMFWNSNASALANMIFCDVPCGDLFRSQNQLMTSFDPDQSHQNISRLTSQNGVEITGSTLQCASSVLQSYAPKAMAGGVWYVAEAMTKLQMLSS